ncbi:putative sieve element occlusion [Rosa chinensis]|uniref:Putative sieve element occlusion n=1 Tax=Rosa chinensis TaxID=74649 RepID=A0A2P6QQ28_ROSCH|nr:protein SIEVE ELEMENT OCCLUSION B [Rosa chinensis]PRQ36289.1 putative sieve element occlusion [Rosa chinensis]
MLGLAHNVATKVASVVHTTQKTIAGELSLFSMPDKKILEEIYTTHVHADESFDDDSLFVIVENILKRATQNVDKIVQGTQVHVDNIEEKNPKASFSVPLCTLKRISCEMQCKPPGDEIAHNTTVAILNKLSEYSWEAKASLTLAAFAMEYGEFWLLAQLRESDNLAKSIAILKRVPVLLKPSELHKRRQSILELNNLIKAILQVIECIDQFNKYSTYDPKDVPDLSIALDHIPVDVYWVIITVVACATKITILTSDEDKEFDLAPYSQKIHYVLNKLTSQQRGCRKQIEEAETYRRITKLFRTPTEIMEVFKGLIFTKDNVQPLIDGSTKQTVKIDILRRNNLLLFISTLDVSDDDISILKPIHEFTKRDNQYKIVWIPIVEQWTDDLRKKFDILKNKMPWFTVQYSGPIAGIKFIKEEWNFKGKPTVVVMNPQGKVEHPNALHIIRVWGVKAFPFTKTTEEELSHSHAGKWVGSVVEGTHPSVHTWIKEDKYIFFYGGKDNEWIQQFTKKATALANDPIFKEAKIHLELVCVGKGSRGEDDHGVLGRFWTSVESLFFTKGHKQVESVNQEIQKLLSYKNESGWAVLSKGSTVLVTGHGVSVLKVVEDFEKWKDHVKEKGFEFCFKAYHEKISQASRPCCRLDIPGSNGKVPESMRCPDCHRNMETFISYKCCHIDGPTAHH